MTIASFDVPAGDDQQNRLQRLQRAAEMMGCDTEIFPEPLGTRRDITFYAWNSHDELYDDEHLEFAIGCWLGVEEHGDWLKEAFPGRYNGDQ